MRGVNPGELVRRAVRHPSDLVALARAGWALRRPGWWRRAPFLPLPDGAYWRFRLVTATGRDDGALSLDELVRAARWSLRQKPGR